MSLRPNRTTLQVTGQTELHSKTLKKEQDGGIWEAGRGRERERRRSGEERMDRRRKGR